MLIAEFSHKGEEIEIENELWQYDYGQRLQIKGLDLPETFEVHFAWKDSEKAKVVIGSTVNGISTVDIPNVALEQRRTITAYIYLSDTTEGETVNTIVLSVNKRKAPENFETPEDVDLFHHTLAATAEYQRQAKESEKQAAARSADAEAWAHGREDHPEQARDNAKYYAEQAAKMVPKIDNAEAAIKQAGQKQIQAIADSLDNTLTAEGKAADAKAVGEKFAKVNKITDSLKEDIDDVNTTVFNIEESPNIFDKTKINQNKGLITWGSPNTSNYTYDKNNFTTSFPIAVNGGSTIYIYSFDVNGIKNANISNLIGFTKDGSFVGIEGQNTNEIKLSENTAYIVFDTNNYSLIESLMITIEPYDGVYQPYGYEKKENKIAKNTDDISKLKEDMIGVVKNEDKTHIIFSFDAFKIDNRFELMKAYGFPFTIAIAQTTLTYPISKDDYYNYFIDGNVDFSVYTGKGDRPSDYRSGKGKWSEWVKGLVDGLKDTSGLFYPVMYSCQNAASSEILNQVVKENGFRMCRNGTYYNADGSTTWGVYTERKYLIDGIKNFDYYPLSVVKSENYPTFDEIKTEIDNAIENKKSIMLFTHYVKDDTETMSDTDCPLSKFKAVLDYVKGKVDSGLCDEKNARQFWNYYNLQDGLDLDYKRTNMRNLFDKGLK